MKKENKKSVCFLKGFFKNFEKEVSKDVKNTENWIIERKKFFIKLFWTVLLIIVLLMVFIFLR